MTNGIEMHAGVYAWARQAFFFDCESAGGTAIAVTGAIRGRQSRHFLNLLPGFDVPAQGRILIAGQDVSAVHPAATAGIACLSGQQSIRASRYLHQRRARHRSSHEARAIDRSISSAH